MQAYERYAEVQGGHGEGQRVYQQRSVRQQQQDFVAKKEKVINVENIAGGPLGGGGGGLHSFPRPPSMNDLSSPIMPWPAPTADHVRRCLAGGCGGRPRSCLWAGCRSGVSASQ